MVNYGNDTINTNETASDFQKIGNVSIEMLDGKLPVYAFLNTDTGSSLLLNEEGLCGGDCFDYI